MCNCRNIFRFKFFLSEENKNRRHRGYEICNIKIKNDLKDSRYILVELMFMISVTKSPTIKDTVRL